MPGKRLALAVLASSFVAVLVAPVTTWASFPGRNGRVALSAETTFKGLAQNAVLYDFNPANRKVRQLTRRAAACRESLGSYSGSDGWVDGGLDYSPNGRRIAYLHADNCRGAETRTGLWIMRADGQAKRRVASFDLFLDTALNEAEAAFSPDGRAVAVVNFAGDDPRGYYVITVFRLPDGAVQHQVFFDGSSIPDGIDWGANNRLVFAIEERLRVLRPDGSPDDSTVVRRPPGWSAGAPDWAPRGGSFVFRGVRFVDERVRGEALWRAYPAEGRAVKLIFGGPVAAPIFSPDGRRIAFVADNGSRIAQFWPSRPGGVSTLMRLRGRMEGIWSISWQPRPPRRTGLPR